MLMWPEETKLLNLTKQPATTYPLPKVYIYIVVLPTDGFFDEWLLHYHTVNNYCIVILSHRDLGGRCRFSQYQPRILFNNLKQFMLNLGSTISRHNQSSTSMNLPMIQNL